MVDVGAVALSGLYASEKRLQVAANNIANANTDGFKSQAVEQTSVAGGGVATRVVVPNAAQAPVNAGDVPKPSDVSLEQNVIEANFATYSAQANLKVLQTQKKLDQYLLDIQA
jgi:flagellar basal body rod protein FlgG